MHADILSTDEVQRYKSLGVYINFIERPMLPSAWLAEMFNIASRKTEDAIRKLETGFEDVVTFRGHPYLRLMEQQYAATQKNKIHIRHKPAGALKEFSEPGVWLTL